MPRKTNKKTKSQKTIEVKINTQIPKSHFVINLKKSLADKLNPSLTEAEKNFSPILNQSNKQNPIKPPRSLPYESRKIGVDFISVNTRKLWQELSLIGLFKPVLPLARKIFSVKKHKLNKQDGFSNQPEEVEDVFAAPSFFSFLGLNVPNNWYKKIAIFAASVVILILPLQAFTYYQKMVETKDKILSITAEAVKNLQAGQQAAIQFNFTDASANFTEAKNYFISAQKEAGAINLLTAEILSLLPNQNQSITSGLSILKAGEILSETGQILTDGINKFVAAQTINDYYQTLVLFQNNLSLALTKFNGAKSYLQKVKISSLPQNQQNNFNQVMTNLPEIQDGLTNLYEVNQALLQLLGYQTWQRYLLIFLNNNELRGGGGFMGSFAILDIDRGQIKKLEIPGGGTYDLQGALVPKIISPEPLHLINPRWEFQDANWWPDYPKTAEKIEWFYQKAGGASVDGVIALTTTLMEELLEIFGPISMPEYDRVITSENFALETQKIVELEYDKKENRPKQFIADLTPKLLEHIFAANKTQREKLMSVLINGLNERQLMVYFNSANIQKIIDEFGWNGSLRATEGDYLSVVHANIAGGKTDAVINQTITHQAEVQADGSMVDTVKIIRRHLGKPGENIFYGVQNNSFVRFYVPQGSTLLSASGFKKPPKNLFEDPPDDYENDLDLISYEREKKVDEKTGMEIYQEKDKTVFAHWLALKPGETGQAEIKYKLPFKLGVSEPGAYYYSLLVQKQAGSRPSELKSNLILNNQFKILSKFPDNLSSDIQQVNFAANLKTDQFYGVLLINQNN